MITPKILIVEDDAEFRDTLIRVLNGYGWEVAAFDNPKEALEVVGEYDVIHTDGNLSQMTGVEFVQSVRKLNRDVYIYMLSGEENFKIPFLSAGGNTFLNKLDLKGWISFVQALSYRYLEDREIA